MYNKMQPGAGGTCHMGCPCLWLWNAAVGRPASELQGGELGFQEHPSWSAQSFHTLWGVHSPGAQWARVGASGRLVLEMKSNLLTWQQQEQEGKANPWQSGSRQRSTDERLHTCKVPKCQVRHCKI